MNPIGVTCTAVLYHLEGVLEESLTAVLMRLGVTVYRLGGAHSATQCVAVAERSGADVIFCGDDRADYRNVIETAAKERSRAVIVVISRLPDTNAWLDALEAGAFDYCAAPVETAQLRWLLESARLRRHGAPDFTWHAA